MHFFQHTTIYIPVYKLFKMAEQTPLTPQTDNVSAMRNKLRASAGALFDIQLRASFVK